MPGAVRPAAEVQQALDALEARGITGIKFWGAYPFNTKSGDLYGAIGFTQTPGEAIWSLLQRNGALAVKAQLALWARTYRETDAAQGRFINLSITQFCDDIGFKRKKRAHTRESKHAAVEVLKLLTSLELVALYRTPQGKTLRLSGALWVRGALAEQMDGYADLFGASRIGDPAVWDPVAFAYAPGFFFGDPEWRKYNHDVALIAEGLLRLGTNTADKWAVMIGGYLAVQVRMNGWKSLRRNVGRLLEATGLMEELKRHRQAGRMREMFERALNRLKEPDIGVIRDWKFASEDTSAEQTEADTDDFSEPEATHWAAAWMNDCIIIDWADEFKLRENSLAEHTHKKIATALKKKARRPPRNEKKV
jgi:hypothetical protein